ncbi:MAG: hypothetical protein LBU73_07190, partial [Helicobacteraceae bacterium]|nr:hypothetical protein [Helicobacteraceae bacterium]
MFKVKKLVISAVSAAFAFALAIPSSAQAAVGVSNVELRFTTAGTLRDQNDAARFQNPNTITVARGARIGVRAFITLTSSGTGARMSCVQLNVLQGGNVVFSAANNRFTERTSGGTYAVDFTDESIAWSAANATAVTLTGRDGQKLRAPTAIGNHSVEIKIYDARASGGANAQVCNSGVSFHTQTFNNVITVADTPTTTTSGANSIPVSMAVDPVFIGFRDGYGAMAETNNLPPSSGMHPVMGYYFPRLMNANQYNPLKVFRGGIVGYEIAALHSKTWAQNQNAATGNPNGLAWTCTEVEILNGATGGNLIANSRVYNDHSQLINGYLNYNAAANPAISAGRITNGGTNNRALWVPPTVTIGNKYAIKFRFYDTNNNSTGLNNASDQPLISGDRRCQGRVISEFIVPNAIEIIGEKVKNVSTSYSAGGTNPGDFAPKTASIAGGMQMRARVTADVDSAGGQNWGCTQAQVLGTNLNVYWNHDNWTSGNGRSTYSNVFYAPTGNKTYDAQYTFYAGDLSGGICGGAVVGQYLEKDAFRTETIAEIGVNNWVTQYREVLYGDFAVIGHGALCIPYGGTVSNPQRPTNHNGSGDMTDAPGRTDGARGDNSESDCMPGQIASANENMGLKFAYIPETHKHSSIIKPGGYDAANKSVKAHPSKSRTAAKLDIPEDAVIRHAKLYWIGALVYRDMFGKDAGFDTSGSLGGSNTDCQKVFNGDPMGARTGRGALELAKNIKLEMKDAAPTPLYAERVYIAGYDQNCHYLAQTDVTHLFGGKTGEEMNGYYFVSDLVTRRSGNPFGTTGGWSLVMTWDRKHDLAQPPRVVTYWDMLDGGASDMATTIDGFLTPQGGDVNTTIFVMGADGDAEDTDRMCLNPTGNSCPTTSIGNPHNGTSGQDDIPNIPLYPYESGKKPTCSQSPYHCNPEFTGRTTMDGPINAFTNSVTVGNVGNSKRPAGQLPHYPMTKRGSAYVPYNNTNGDLSWSLDDPQANYNLGFDLHVFHLSNYIGHGRKTAKLRVSPNNDHVELGVLGFSTMVFAPDFRHGFEKNSTIEYSETAPSCDADKSVEDANVSYTVRFK